MYLSQKDFQELEGFGDWCGIMLLKAFPDAFNTADIVDISFAMEMSIRFEQLKLKIDTRIAENPEWKRTHIIQKVLQPYENSVLSYLRQFNSPAEAVRNLTNDTRNADDIFHLSV